MEKFTSKGATEAMEILVENNSEEIGSSMKGTTKLKFYKPVRSLTKRELIRALLRFEQSQEDSHTGAEFNCTKLWGTLLQTTEQSAVNKWRLTAKM